MKTIWHNKDNSASVLQDKHGGLRFRYYAIGYGTTCEYSLFCEVGEKFRTLFDEFFASHSLKEGNCDVACVRYDSAPYYADQLA